MGGFGCGSWPRIEKKTTVAECLWLDAGRLARKRAFVPGCSGAVTWTDSHGTQTASVGLLVTPADGNGLMLRLIYRWNGEDVFVPVRLQMTQPNYGGNR